MTKENGNKEFDKQNAFVLDSCSENAGMGVISSNAIARIVTKVATEIEGVARFAPKGAGDILNFFTGKAYDSSLAINYAENKINLTLALNLYYGCSIPDVVKAVREKVAAEVTALTGSEVGKVNVLVKDLVEHDAEEEKTEEEEA